MEACRNVKRPATPMVRNPAFSLGFAADMSQPSVEVLAFLILVADAEDSVFGWQMASLHKPRLQA